VFIRRDRNRRGPPDSAILLWQVSLFFLAAGLWLAGLAAGDRRLTGAAIVVLLAAIVLRLVRDRSNEETPEASDEDDSAEGPTRTGDSG
jgi:uncharacterized membrane protein